MKQVRLHAILAALALSAFSSCGGEPTGPQLPAALNLVSGNGQSGVVGQALPSPLVVKVVDASGVGVPEVPVTWSVASGGGSVSSNSSTTDAQGLASTTWTLGLLAGSNGATASVAGVAAITPVSFTATAQAGAAAKLAFTVQPSAVLAGAAIAPAVQVVVQDAQGNTATSAATSVTLAITSGTGTTGAVLGGTLTLAAANGVATFSNLTIDKVGTGYTLTATAAVLTSATSSAIAVSPGPAAKLAFTVQPSAVLAGAAITPAVQVVVQDAPGNTVTSATTSVTLAITSGTGTTGAVLGGTLTQAAASGVATFSNLTIDRAGTSYTLTASASGMTSAVSGSFTAIPFTMVFINSTYTPVTISVDGTPAPNPIAAGGNVSVTRASGRPASLTYSATTSGTNSAGGRVGLLISWNYTLVPANASADTVTMYVTSSSFFLRLQNSGFSTLSPLYVNYGLTDQTMDNISIPADGVIYNIGYYKAYTNSNVRAYKYPYTGAYVYWNQGTHFTLPFTSNQAVTLLNNVVAAQAVAPIERLSAGSPLAGELVPASDENRSLRVPLRGRLHAGRVQ